MEPYQLNTKMKLLFADLQPCSFLSCLPRRQSLLVKEMKNSKDYLHGFK